MAAVERSAVGLLMLALGCSSTASSDNSSDPEPVFAPGERDALSALHYDDGPPPSDPSNRFADDPAARAFGQRLFFEPGFSGQLLEGDNDGSSATLGMRGDSGRVSCSGCHLPSAGFVDTRSPHQQVSLGAQWKIGRAHV